MTTKYISAHNAILKEMGPSSGSRYIKFEAVDESRKDTLNAQFLGELEKLNKDTVCKDLFDILTTRKLKVTFFQSPVDYYLVIISSYSDSLLISLGQTYGFPRGFPLIWQPSKVLNMYGFYPKFNNDAIKEDEFNKSELDNAIEINFNFKYSGFLGQVIPFTIGGEYFWTTCGKNSTNYKYSEIVYDLINDKITPEFLRMLCEEKIHFCGETISRFDQTHGAAVTKDGFVTTLVAKGHWIKFDEAEVRISGVPDKFIKAFDQTEMHDFCLRTGLLIDAIFKVTTYESLLEYMIGLNNRRNMIQLNTFLDYWSEFNSKNGAKCETKSGNIRHNEYLGNILEGLIIKVTLNKGGVISNKTIKYKFPFYTSRTMLLREFLKKNEEEISKTSSLPASFYDEMFEFIDRWVVKYENHKNYWRFMLALFFQRFPAFNSAYEGYAAGITDKETIVGKHIFIMDLFVGDPITVYNKSFNYLEELHRLIPSEIIEKYHFTDERRFTETSEVDKECNMVPLILSLGPIGAGKSTISSLIESSSPSKFKHIDGDILDLTMEKVLKLSSERNEYTLYKLVEAIIDSKIPILSMGGGVLLKGAGDVILMDYLNSIFYNRVKFVPTILLPFKYKAGDKSILELSDERLKTFVAECNAQVITPAVEFPEESLLGALFELYNNEARFRATYDQRYAASHVKPDFGSLFKANKKNFDITVKIIAHLGKDESIKIMFYPLVTPLRDVPVEQNTVLTDLLKDMTISNKIIPSFKQKRVLLDYTIDAPTFHHITLEYKKDGGVLYEDIHKDKFNSIMNRDIDGRLYLCPSKQVIDNLMKIKELTRLIIDTPLKEQIPASIKRDEILGKLVALDETILNRLLGNYGEFRHEGLLKDLNAQLGGTLKRIAGTVKKDSTELAARLNEMETKGFMNFNFKEKWSIRVILFPGLFKDELATSAHVTVDEGLHKAYEMKSVAKNIYEYAGGESIITLGSQKYCFDIKDVAIRCHFYGLFYI
jgi:shikimate kinase